MPSLRSLFRTHGLWPLLALLATPAWALEAQQLVGAWQGEVRFLNASVKKEHGGLPVQFDIQPDLTLTGTIGDARIGPTKPQRQVGRVDYRIVLDREPLPQANFSKKKVVLLITRVNDGVMDVDLHFKSYFAFDPTMWVANVQARQRAAP